MWWLGQTEGHYPSSNQGVERSPSVHVEAPCNARPMPRHACPRVFFSSSVLDPRVELRCLARNRTDQTSLLGQNQSISLTQTRPIRSVPPRRLRSSATHTSTTHTRHTKTTESSNAGGQGIHFNRLRRRPKSKSTKQNNKTSTDSFLLVPCFFCVTFRGCGRTRGGGLDADGNRRRHHTRRRPPASDTARCVVSARFFVCTPLVFPLSAFKRSAPSPLPKTPQTYTTRTHKR